MINASMNCYVCGRFTSIKTCESYDTEISDLDGIVCISQMKCKKCHFKISTNTIKMIESSLLNLSKGITSKPVNIKEMNKLKERL